MQSSDTATQPSCPVDELLHVAVWLSRRARNFLKVKPPEIPEHGTLAGPKA